MGSSAIETIERQFVELPSEAQELVFEHLSRYMHKQTQKKKEEWEKELVAMALDPDIQREIANIEREFGVAESDGLRPE